MVRLLIVEDERVTRETICRLIPWEEYGIRLIGACANGIEAFDMILDEYPDVVLTDIRMPGLDGLGLIERVQGMDMGMEFIILSGYGEFEYAKTAMRFGVREYLLKPCDEKQIVEALLRAKVEVTKRREAQRIRREQEFLTGAFSTSIRRQLTVEAIMEDSNFAALMDKYDGLVRFPQGEYHLYCVSFLEEHLLDRFFTEITGLVKDSGAELCFNLLYVKNTALLMLCFPDAADRAAFDGALGNLRLPGAQVELCWWQEPHETVQSMLEALVEKLRRYTRVTLIDDTGGRQEIHNYVTALRGVESTLHMLETMEDRDGITSLITSLLDSTEDVELARMLAMRVVVQFSAQSRLLRPAETQEFLTRLYECTEQADILGLTLERLSALADERERQRRNYKDFVQQAIDYVQEHMEDPNLSMKWLAENYLYMNVDYFSRQFIKQTGEKFSAYLGRVRMEKAKELILQYDSDRIYKVAEQVGCGHNPQYFSQMFKKCTGCTPSQYREQNIREK